MIPGLSPAKRMMSRASILVLPACVLAAALIPAAGTAGQKGKGKAPASPLAYPPELPGKGETATLTIDGAEVDFAYYPCQTYPGKTWSAWGDGCAAGGRYYSGIGDHDSPKGGAYLYEYDPAAKKLRLLADVRKFLEEGKLLPEGMDYVPGKIHSRISMGGDGRLYYATHRGSEKTTTDAYGYRGDWILRTDPKTAATEVVAAFPVEKHCLPAGVLDPERLVYYAGTAPGADAPEKGVRFLAYDCRNRKALKVAPDGFDRCAIFSSTTGCLYWAVREKRGGARDEEEEGDGEAPGGALKGFKYDPKTNEITACPGVPHVRSATRESKDGIVYGTSARDCTLWAFDVKAEKAAVLGDGKVGEASYTVSMELDPTERYLYYTPGAHGGSELDGTPIVRFDLKTKEKKVLLRLAPALKEKFGYVPIGTFSSALSEDGRILFVTWNGSRKGPKGARGTYGWDTCAMTAIRLPQAE